MTEDDGQVVQQVLFFAVLIGGFYLLAIRPQRARARALAQVRAGLVLGSRVITTAGIHATVVQILDDHTLLLEIADGVRVVFAAAAVVRLVEDSPPDQRPPDQTS